MSVFTVFDALLAQVELLSTQRIGTGIEMGMGTGDREWGWGWVSNYQTDRHCLYSVLIKTNHNRDYDNYSTLL